MKSKIVNIGGYKRSLTIGNYYREVDTGKIIGNLPNSKGGTETTVITIYTDSAGNLVNTYPGKFSY